MGKFRYLRQRGSPKRSFVVTITMLTQIFLAFLIGVVIGFNIKDIMIRACTSINPTPKHVIAESLARTNPPPPTFTKLPDKYLKNFPPENATSAFLLRPWKYVAQIKNNTPHYFTTFLVKSAAWLAFRRILVRKTWGSISTVNQHRFGLVFIVGSTLNDEQQELLAQENAMYGDILQCDVTDDYLNLPRKVLAAFQWMTYEVGDVSEYYVTTYDDCSINIPTMYDYFVTNKSEKLEYMHCGYVYGRNSVVVRNPKSKYGIPPNVYPYDAYPTFCHGGMTVMSYRFIRDLYMTSQVTNYDDFHLEDVLITGILREKMDNDSRRIVPKGHHGMGGAVRRSEVLVWHMGLARRLDVAFEARWHRIRSGMRILAYDKLLVGKQPSAALLNATLRATPTLPGMTLMDTMHEFANKWRQLRKPSGVRFSGVVTRAKPRTLPDYRGQREEEEE